MTHDYKRNGTTTLFAALNMLDGTVIGACMPRHRHREFLRFLKLIDQQTPAGLDLHLIVDNYATHKTPAVKRWIKLHPRFQLHFTPTSASWLNMVERFFAEITRKRIRRGAFKSVAELKDAIIEYLENHNADPKPFIWTKSAGQILEKVARAKQALKSTTQPIAVVLVPFAKHYARRGSLARCGLRCPSRGLGDANRRSPCVAMLTPGARLPSQAFFGVACAADGRESATWHSSQESLRRSTGFGQGSTTGDGATPLGGCAAIANRRRRWFAKVRLEAVGTPRRRRSRRQWAKVGSPSAAGAAAMWRRGWTGC